MRGLDIEARSGARSIGAGPIRVQELEARPSIQDRPEVSVQELEARRGTQGRREVDIGAGETLAETIKRESSKLEKSGAVIERVSDKAALQNHVKTKVEAQRQESAGFDAGDRAEDNAARELRLRVKLNRGMMKVRYPEAQIKYAGRDGKTHYLNIATEPEQDKAYGAGRREEARQRYAEKVRIKYEQQRKPEAEQRREKDQGRERIDIEERKRRAVDDVATYRVVSVRDLVEERFGGNAFAARKAIDALKREGKLEEHAVMVKSGKSFKVLTATGQGRREARERTGNSRQRYWAGAVKPGEQRHDAAVYRAARTEIAALQKDGCRVKRIELDYEMKGRVARASERARAKDGKEAAQKAKRAEAEKIGLPVDKKDHVSYPDARIEYENEQGEAGRVSIEVTSDGYRSKDIQAKAAAGFALYANGRSAMKKLASALRQGDSGRGSGSGGGGRKDDELFEL